MSLHRDGPGAFDFIQGDNSSNPQNPFWELVKGAVTPLPPPEQVACQSPKPILLDTVSFVIKFMLSFSC
jgi:neutral ceramidase